MLYRRAAGARVYLCCLIIAAAAVMICSKSSPLYPVNDWSDANIFFTMGKGMLRGRVLYRDLYDHKGPLLYGLHALCALISDTSFLGVYLMETISFSLFLLGAYRTLELFCVKRAGIALLPMAAAFILSSLSFQSGDSAEELCLPLITWSLYLLLRYLLVSYPRPPGFGLSLAQGALAGCAMWIKFTLLGFFGGVGITLLFLCLYKKRVKGALTLAAGYALGFVAVTLPWMAYFAANGAIGVFLKTYIYDNIFLYGESYAPLIRLKEMLKCLRDSLLQNHPFTSLIALGLLYATLSRSVPPRVKAALWFTSGLMCLGVFWGGKQYLYYGFVLAAFAPIGLVPIGLLIEKRLLPKIKSASAKRVICAAALALSLVYCRAFGHNTSELLKPYEETMQHKLKIHAEITEETTLLNYGFMDAGFYLAFDIVPTCRYFCQTNVPLPEMLSEQQRYIDEGLNEYVVARSDRVKNIYEKYDLIATADSPDGFWYDHVYLYRLKE